MRRRSILLAVAAAVALGGLIGCGSSSPASPDRDRPVSTTEALRTTLLPTAPVTLPPSERPKAADRSSVGYEVAGTGGVWIQPNGDAVVVDCSTSDPSPAIRAAAIPGYRGIWTCV